MHCSHLSHVVDGKRHLWWQLPLGDHPFQLPLSDDGVTKGQGQGRKWFNFLSQMLFFF